MTALPPDLEALMPEPAFKLTWRGDLARYFVSKPNIGNTAVFTADQVREAMQATDERAAKQRQDIEAALLWCVRNLTEYGSHRMLSDPSNGVMRAVDAIRAASMHEGGGKTP
jgi:hypothetical protein